MFIKKKKTNGEQVLLKSVDTDVEACVIQSLLASCGIVCNLKYNGDLEVSKVIVGNSNLGVNIYVNKEDAEAAEAILKAPAEETDAGFEEEDK